MITEMYKSLGMVLYEPGVENQKIRYYDRDGSTSEENKLWALRKLGFKNTRYVKFQSWCELTVRAPGRCRSPKRNVISIVPFSATYKNYKIFLHPKSIPGNFGISVFLEQEEYFLERTYKPHQILEAFTDAVQVKNNYQNLKEALHNHTLLIFLMQASVKPS